MSIFVFTGPTLSAAEARRVLEAVYLPPVAQGDVYRVARESPQAIGIIDGYFERLPAVWHKEILWAMSQGIHVFGSASMGALRAAELTAFGMEGVGWIFEAYLTGVLEDDDELAVAHGPPESSYRVSSVAMVNIRRTLEKAAYEGVIGGETQRALERIAKDLFYPERHYTRILERGRTQDLAAAELEAFRAWLPAGKIDQKRDDALAMLQVMQARLNEGFAPKRVEYRFEYTVFWDAAQKGAGEFRLDAETGNQMLVLRRLLEELYLDPDAYRQARQEVEIAALTRALATALGQAVPPAARQGAIETFRRDHGLFEPGTTTHWLAERGLSPAVFDEWIEDQVLLHWAESWALPNLGPRLVDYLRLVDAYERLRARAEQKEQVLEARGLTNPGLAEARVTQAELLDWYFVGQLSREIPRDLTRYAREAGFGDEQSLLTSLAREFCYQAYAPGAGGFRQA